MHTVFKPKVRFFNPLLYQLSYRAKGQIIASQFHRPAPNPDCLNLLFLLNSAPHLILPPKSQLQSKGFIAKFAGR